MGHTHYNELANDGRTVYAATRSTGQIEEGPVGYAVAALDGGVVSWRFKELARPWPFVLITAPADRRLAFDAGHVVGERFTLRALVLGAAERVEFRIDDGPWRAMTRPDGARCHEAAVTWPAGARAIAVRAQAAAPRTPTSSSRRATPTASRPPAASAAATPTRSASGRTGDCSAPSSARTATGGNGEGGPRRPSDPHLPPTRDLILRCEQGEPRRRAPDASAIPGGLLRGRERMEASLAEPARPLPPLPTVTTGPLTPWPR